MLCHRSLLCSPSVLVGRAIDSAREDRYNNSGIISADDNGFMTCKDKVETKIVINDSQRIHVALPTESELDEVFVDISTMDKLCTCCVDWKWDSWTWHGIDMWRVQSFSVQKLLEVGGDRRRMAAVNHLTISVTVIPLFIRKLCEGIVWHSLTAPQQTKLDMKLKEVMLHNL